MKKYYDLANIAILGVCIVVLYNQNNKTKEENAVLVSNQKAFMAENSALKDENRVFKFTVEQLNYSNDSILQEMNKVRKSLSIKDKNLNQIQYITSEITKVDTLVFRDTIFQEPSLDIDTTLNDEWYNLRLHLKYPSTIVTTPSFRSDKYILVESVKETVNPPKKFWLFRLFQKKHTVLKVDVVEKNPYIKNKDSRFIEILK